jgi:hypothetical protein
LPELLPNFLKADSRSFQAASRPLLKIPHFALQYDGDGRRLSAIILSDAIRLPDRACTDSSGISGRSTYGTLPAFGSCQRSEEFMSKPGRPIILLIPVLVGIAYGLPARAEPLPVTTRVHARFTIEGKFARYLVSPNGQIDGLVLADGSVTRFPPHALTPETAPFQSGDAIHLEGEAVNGPAGPVLAHASVTKGNATVVRSDLLKPVASGGPGAGPRSHGGKRSPEGASGLHEESLRPMTVTGEIEGFSIDSHGRLDRILFVDGTNARAGKQVRLETLALKAGDIITVTGQGGTYAQGSSLHIATMKLPTGEVRTFDPLQANLIPVSHEGEVVCILLDPRGDLDGFLLKDGTLVRVRPAAPDPRLLVGSNVRAEGEGTSSFIRADKVTLTSTGAVLDLSTPPRAVRVPRVLTMLVGSSTILRVVNDRGGRLDTLVLEDGSIVKLPPTLRDQAGDSLSVGTKLTARGIGGTYGLVKAFRADRLQLASGQVFAEPERGPPPPPAKR